MRKRTTQLSVLLAALAFSSMASSVFSGEPLRGSFTVIITTHLAMIARSNESYFLSRPIYRRSNNGIAGDGDAVDHNSTRSNNGIVGGGEQHKIYDYVWAEDDPRKDQYEGSRAGAKPNGAVILSDRVHYGDGDAVDHNSSRSNHGIGGEGGGVTEQMGSVGSFYQGARGGEGSGGHGDITGAIRVAQHHDWIVQQINDGGDDVVNILTTKIPNSTGQQINCVELIFTKDEGAGQQIIEFDDVISFSDFDQGIDLQDINHDGRIRVSEIITADLGFGYDTFGIRKAITDNDVGSADGDNRPVPMERIIRLLQQVDGGGSDDNLTWSFTISPNYVKISGLADNDSNAITEMIRLIDDTYAGSAGGNGTHDTALGQFIVCADWGIPPKSMSNESDGDWEYIGAGGYGKSTDHGGADDLNAMDVLGRRWRGDANRDGVVTGTDLIVVQQNFGMSVALDGLLDGDANNDGQVTGMDLIEVQQTFGQVTGNAIVGSGLSNGVIVDDNHFIGPLVSGVLQAGTELILRGGNSVFSVHNNTFGQVESTDAAVVAAVPEPATIALMSAGLLFMRKTRRTR